MGNGRSALISYEALAVRDVWFGGDVCTCAGPVPGAEESSSARTVRSSRSGVNGFWRNVVRCGSMPLLTEMFIFSGTQEAYPITVS